MDEMRKQELESSEMAMSEALGRVLVLVMDESFDHTDDDRWRSDPRTQFIRLTSSTMNRTFIN